MQHTDLDAIKNIAIQLIYIKPELTKGFNFWMHPYINNSAIPLPNEDKPLSIFHDLECYRVWQEQCEEEIRQRKNVYSIACLIRTCYMPIFFESIKEYLSEKDYAEILVEFWTASGMADVPKDKFLLWFEEANKAYLMSKSEQKEYDKLPEKVTIYRGVNNPEYRYGFSWTLDKRIANWFANRYEGKKSYVYECTVDKKDILCFLEIRNEKEVIINPEVLKDYEIRIMNCQT